MIDVEVPLIDGQLASIDQQLEKAISVLNWTSEGTSSSYMYVCMFNKIQKHFQ